MTVVLLLLALLAWPPAAVNGRLRRMTGRSRWSPALRWPRPGVGLVGVGAGAVGWTQLGPAGGAALALVGATAWRRWQARRDLRVRLAAVAGLAEALRALVGELVAGAHPVAATESVAGDAPPPVAQVLRSIAAAVALGGDVRLALASCPPALVEPVDALSRAWLLVTRYGLPLADVLDAVRRDLDQRVRFAHQVLARMAGPRASATVLAALPAIGVLLGQAMGANPLRVLTSPGIGSVLLLIGVVLACAGVQWSARLTERVVLR